MNRATPTLKTARIADFLDLGNGYVLRAKAPDHLVAGLTKDFFIEPEPAVTNSSMVHAARISKPFSG